jgi:ribosomal protein S6--L-glutamate ligase
MRIAVISGGEGWHVCDLRRAALARGHEVEVLDFRRLGATVGAGYRLAPPAPAVVVRTMPPGSLEQVVFRMDVLQRWQAAGVVILNSPRALEICIDKYLCSARLEAAGLRVPLTCVCQNAEDALAALEALGGDVVVKPLFGSEGRGMVRVSDPELAWRTFRTLERTQTVLYLQQFVAHPGWDLRVFVIGGRVVAGMRRHARTGWRTNVAQGGRAEAVRVTPEQERLALRAAEAVGVTVAGVDLLPGPDGDWYVLEVNAVPGWRALGPATGVDVAAEIVRHLGEVAREHV